MRFKLRHLDPLDRKLVERALESDWVAFKSNVPSGELDSDEELEANLRRELIEIALVNGARDAETLRDILLDHAVGAMKKSQESNLDPLRGHQRIGMR